MTLLWAPITRDVVTIVGPDAATFLQGQVSQEVLGLAPGASAWTFVLAPTGKVDGFARVQRAEEACFALDTEAGFGPALAARLQRFKLRVKAEISLAAAVAGVALRGEGAAAVPGALVGWWMVGHAADLLGDAVEAPAGAEPLGDLERLRIEAGWPAMGAELTPDTIPAEAGVVPVAVSFTKGCFTGQELVARIDSRGGHVPRHLRRLRAAGSAPIAAGARLVADGHDVGWVTSTAGDVALGYVGRAVEPPAVVATDGTDGTDVTDGTDGTDGTDSTDVTVEAITPPVSPPR